jgi:hypothetical protein
MARMGYSEATTLNDPETPSPWPRTRFQGLFEMCRMRSPPAARDEEPRA